MDKTQELINEALSLHQAGQIAKAIEIYTNILPQSLENHQLLYLLGTAYAQTGNYDSSLNFLTQSLQINPNNPAALNNRGIALQERKRFHEAIADYNKAIEIKSNYTDAYSNRGNAFRQLKQYKEALENYDNAIMHNSSHYDAYKNRGIVLKDLKRLDEAVACYIKVIELNPNDAAAHNNLGVVLKELELFDDALKVFNNAIKLKHDYAEAYFNRGNVYKETGKYHEALSDYNNAIDLKPNEHLISGQRNHLLMHLCEWDKFNLFVAETNEKVSARIKCCTPFVFLGLSDSTRLQKIATEVYTETEYLNKEIRHSETFKDAELITIGYYPADFYSNATMHLIAELFENHDKNKFNIIAFSLGKNTNDIWQSRAKNSFNQYIDCSHMSDL